MIDSRPSYGFLMALRVGNCEEKDFISILGMTEAFVLRRHICKARSSEIETVFARLCGIDPSDPIPEVTNVFKEYSPSNDKFRSDFSSFAFTANLIDRARYCLEQFELKKHRNTGELKVSGAGEVHVEHIIPKNVPHGSGRSHRARACRLAAPLGGGVAGPSDSARSTRTSALHGPPSDGERLRRYPRQRREARQSPARAAR